MLHSLAGVFIFRELHHILDNELSDTIFLFVGENLPASLNRFTFTKNLHLRPHLIFEERRILCLDFVPGSRSYPQSAKRQGAI